MKFQKYLLSYINSSCANLNEKYPNTLNCPNTPQLYSNPISNFDPISTFEYNQF